MTLDEARNILAQPIRFGDRPNWKLRAEAKRVQDVYHRLLVLEEDDRERQQILAKFPALRREV